MNGGKLLVMGKGEGHFKVNNWSMVTSEVVALRKFCPLVTIEKRPIENYFLA